MKRLDHYWYSDNPVSLLLAPLSWLFCLLALLRRYAYRIGILPVERLPVPVIVVGNLTVGGTGKTPLVVWLAEFLKSAGYHPGIVSRGYGSQSKESPVLVNAGSDPREVGDEPVLMALRTRCPLAVSRHRAEAARLLVEQGVDLIIADDGMQHYRLGRDVEIAVIDGERRFGNGRCLPAGPLRERPSRLRSVDMVVVNGREGGAELPMQLVASDAVSLKGGVARSLACWSRHRVHAVAGIGNPQRFFATLQKAGIEVVPHPFPDHHRFVAEDLQFGDDLPLFMTEKDAVKCKAFAGEQQWYVPVTAQLPPSFGEQLLERLKR